MTRGDSKDDLYTYLHDHVAGAQHAIQLFEALKETHGGGPVGQFAGKQRPGTASGVVFLTVSGETGNFNVFVSPAFFEENRRLITTAKFLVVEGLQTGFLAVKVGDDLVNVAAWILAEGQHPESPGAAAPEFPVIPCSAV